MKSCCRPAHWSSLSLAMAGVVALALLLGCTTAMARVDSEVRVLLYNAADPIQVGPAKAPEELRLDAQGTLRVAGRLVPSQWSPSGKGPWRVGSRTVRGRIRVQATDGRIQILNRVGLEDYVASTVGSEMSPSWPKAALRAQAVATRTYVLHEAAKRRRSSWDVLATVASQVYRGIGAETPETRAAARATAGEVLTHSGAPILAVFHSTAGGRTATAGEVWGEDRPYLKILEVEEEDDAPHTYWRTTFESGALQGAIEASGPSIGRLQALEIAGRTRSGRVRALRIRGSEDTALLEGSALRSLLGALGLRSKLFEVRQTAEGFAFVGSGYGHGVGMSQWGARSMAQRGASYQRILARFYPGTRLEKLRAQRVAQSETGRFGQRATSVQIDDVDVEGEE